MNKSIQSKLKNGPWLVVMDIIVINAAFILTLLLRYYVHSEFKTAAWTFVNRYVRFAPIYTLLCLVVFFICGLYEGVWRFAGINDFNRILLANVLTAILNVLGLMLFFGGMPKTYYIVGGLLQLLFTAALRFSYRFLELKRQRDIREKTWTIPAMVVGTGDSAREFIHYLEENTPFQVAAIAGENQGKSMDGVPIVSYDAIPAQIQYNDIRVLFIADDALSAEKRSMIRQSAGEIEVRDYIEYLSDLAGGLPLTILLRAIEGPVTVSLDGVERHFSDAGECLAALAGHYDVKGIRGATIELKLQDEKPQGA